MAEWSVRLCFVLPSTFEITFVNFDSYYEKLSNSYGKLRRDSDEPIGSVEFYDRSERGRKRQFKNQLRC